MVTRTSACPDFDVRPFHARDLDEVLAIELTSFSEPWTRGMFEAELQGNPFGRFLGAFSAGEVSPVKPLLGYICYWVVFEELRLMNLAVRQDCRRLGIASRLVRHAVEEGGTEGATRALLEVRAGNRVGQQLYRALGFRPYGCRRSYYTNPIEDAILMQLPLTNHIHL
jgi:ribosomal-protein-alanine N-acetyltransferase